MAPLSYSDATKKLEEIVSTTTPEEFVYDLLRIFGGVTETSIKRIKEGRGNMAKDGVTVLAKFGKPQRVIAYRPATETTLEVELEVLKKDKQVLAKKARLYVVSDGRRVMAYDPREEESYDNDVATLWKDFDFFMPLSGVEKFENIEENEADVKASYIMAKIYDDIRRYNNIRSEKEIEGLNVFLTRLLFCFFAEDTGIFEEQLFTRSVEIYTKADGSDLKDYIEGAFDMMNIESALVREKMPKALRQFPYVNGGLFRERFSVPQLSRRTRELILKCGGYSWQEINPDIFGSMIQAVIRPEDRAGLGLHYTSVPNILKVIRPLFLEALYEEYMQSRDSVKKLDKLLIRLSSIKFFDPACGSGNFLIIAYKEVRKLEIQIWDRISELGGGEMLPVSQIALTQFYGIEIDEFAQETATLSLWLAEHQMNKMFNVKFNVKSNALPLKASGRIVQGNACRLDWATVCPHTPEEEVYLLGNPPYLGSSMQNAEQKADLAFVCQGFDNFKNLDYIACWFILGARYAKDSKAKYAFVTTNSICQGEQVALLWKYIFNQQLEIFFAYTSFKWANNAKYNAGVTCVIVGIGVIGKTSKYIIDDTLKKEVNLINAYLVDGNNIIIEKRSDSMSVFPEMTYGNKPTDDGALILSVDEKKSFVAEFPHLEYLVKKFIGSDEFINGFERYCLWIPEEMPDEISMNPVIASRLEKCRKMRMNSKKIPTQKLALIPWSFGEIRHKDSDSIIIPRVSSERREYIPMGFLDANTVVSDSAFAIYDAQVWLFGVLTSKMHMAWVKAVGGRLKSDYRYSATLCYNTFPFPKISAEQRAELEAYAQEVLLVREEFTGKTLAQLYDPESMPVSLRNAHHDLDLAVDRCYRPEPFSSEEERLEYLFKLYDKMTAK